MTTRHPWVDTVLDESWRINRFEGPVGTPVQVSYSFMGEAPVSGAYRDETILAFRPLAPSTELAVRVALNEVEAAAGLRFVPVDTRGMLQFGHYDGRSSIPPEIKNVVGEAILQWRHDTRPAADVWLTHTNAAYTDYQPGEGLGYYLLLHEIGHTLGLKHPARYSEFDEPPYLPDALDDGSNTVMSYDYNVADGVALGELDILALQYFYGAPLLPEDGRYAQVAPLLARDGVEVEQAQAFVAANVNAPDVLAQAASEHALTLAMLEELVGFEEASWERYFDEAGVEWQAWALSDEQRAANHLSAWGVSVEEAQTFIMANLAAPQLIGDTAHAHALNVPMLAGIVGVSATEVEGYFAQRGVDTSLLV